MKLFKVAHKVISNVFYYVTPSIKKSDSLLPSELLFITLNPNETYITEIEDLGFFSGDNSEKIIQGVFVKYEILVWSGQKNFGEQLKEKWKQIGSLWLEPIITNYILLKIDKSENLSKCIQ